jgi:YD repeat-containing protein
MFKKYVLPRVLLTILMSVLLLTAAVLVGTTPAFADGSVSYTYDDAGRLVSVDYGGGKFIAYTYDDAGNLMQRCTLTVDFNPDRQVNVADIMEVARRWRCRSRDACYDADYDLDKDGDIDVVDIMLVAVHWGENCG